MTLRVPAAIQARLLDLLELDTEQLTVARSIRDAVEAIAMLDADTEYQALVREAEDVAELLDDVDREIAHVESDIRVARERIERDRAREQTSTDPKELSSLEHEIGSLERRIALLEEQELETLARREELGTRHGALASKRDAFHSDRDARVHALRGEIDAHERRSADIAAARLALIAELPAELIALYEKQRERYGVGASFLQRGISGASGVTLTAGQLHEIRAADPDDVLLCPDSNAILIRTAESGL
jgi:predicted  nucleic acid-binding Zn-ribbon protein